MAAFDEPKSWIALFAGFFITALGIIPLLSKWGVLGFNLPEFILKLMPTLAIWLIVAIALLLFIDALWEDDTIRVISVLLAIIFLALGLIQILGTFEVIGFMLPLSVMVYYILFLIEGFFLIIAAFAMD